MAEDGMKECPKCAEHVKARATVCRYCGYEFKDVLKAPTPAPAPAPVRAGALEAALAEQLPQKKKGRWGKRLLIIFLLLILGAGGWYGYQNWQWLYQQYLAWRHPTTPTLVFPESCHALPMRDGRLTKEMDVRGNEARTIEARQAARTTETRLADQRLSSATLHGTESKRVDVNAVIEAAAEDPHDPDNDYNIGTAYLFNFEPSKAIEYLTKATALLPQDDGALANLAAAYFQAHQYEQAVSRAQQALGLNPHNTYAMNVLGLCAYREKRWPDAQKEFQAALTDTPVCADAYINLGNTFHAQDNKDMALQKYQQALAFDNTRGLANICLGNQAYQDGSNQEAQTHWKQAVDEARSLSDSTIALVNKNIQIIKSKP
jgi:tetratricopeptide (TPR) repeat protein